MIFYTITRGEAVLDWADTQEKAKQAVKDQQAKHDPDLPITWQQYEVPTDKPTLLEFLKANCVGKPIAVVTRISTPPRHPMDQMDTTPKATRDNPL